MFLELSTRRLLSKSAKIRCRDRHHVSYIRDRSYGFWKFKLGRNKFERILLQDHYFQQKMALPKLRTFTSKLLHYERTRTHRTTLLEILATQHDNLETLMDFKTKGGGSILKGIATAMGDAVDTAANTASYISRMIAHGATDVKNDTAQANDGI